MMALGADWCNAARGFMFALGCIQAQTCHTGNCPTGVDHAGRPPRAGPGRARRRPSGCTASTQNTLKALAGAGAGRRPQPPGADHRVPHRAAHQQPRGRSCSRTCSRSCGRACCWRVNCPAACSRSTGPWPGPTASRWRRRRRRRPSDQGPHGPLFAGMRSAGQVDKNSSRLIALPYLLACPPPCRPSFCCNATMKPARTCDQHRRRPARFEVHRPDPHRRRHAGAAEDLPPDILMADLRVQDGVHHWPAEELRQPARPQRPARAARAGHAMAARRRPCCSRPCGPAPTATGCIRARPTLLIADAASSSPAAKSPMSPHDRPAAAEPLRPPRRAPRRGSHAGRSSSRAPNARS